jgi:hypothetical protein
MTTSRILACYQTRKTPDFAPTQQFAMDRVRFELATCARLAEGASGVVRSHFLVMSNTPQHVAHTWEVTARPTFNGPIAVFEIRVRVPDLAVDVKLHEM